MNGTSEIFYQRDTVSAYIQHNKKAHFLLDRDQILCGAEECPRTAWSASNLSPFWISISCVDCVGGKAEICAFFHKVEWLSSVWSPPQNFVHHLGMGRKDRAVLFLVLELKGDGLTFRIYLWLWCSGFVNQSGPKSPWSHNSLVRVERIVAPFVRRGR